MTVCLNGAVECVQTVQPSAEVCNGLDDDCDGAVDNGTGLCPDGGCCDSGACGSACGQECCTGAEVCNPDGPACCATADQICGNGCCPPMTTCGPSSLGACCGLPGFPCVANDACCSGNCVSTATSQVCSDS
jgi:hypothetical protein